MKSRFMTRGNAVVFCLGVALWGVTAPKAGLARGAAGGGVVQIKRPNLVVEDLDRSLRLYRDILGFKVFAVGDSQSDSYSYPVFRFPKEARLRMATLSTDTHVRALALTEVRGVRLPPLPVPHRTAVVIQVQGLEQIMKRVEAEGLKVVPATSSRTAEGQTFIEQAFEDYDGHLIVLYELRP